MHDVAMATRRQVQPAPSDMWGPLPPHATRPRPGWGGHASPRRSTILKLIERGLLIVAIACLGYYGYVSAETMLYQAQENRALDELLLRSEVPASASSGATRTAVRRVITPGETVGRIEIPRLRVSAIIKGGIDARTLQLAVGHIPGTAFPGEVGNVGLAAHRDTFFRRLRDIEPDDEIVLTTPEGSFKYRVARTDIVEPHDVWVLDPTDHPALTLVTCYPFNYVGSAPQRFIVRAQRTEEGPT
jgi:sortase A